MAKRTDQHRPGTIDPSAYAYLLTYSLGWGNRAAYDVPSNEWTWGLDLLDAATALRIPGAGEFGRKGKCGICGAVFSHGDLWQHASGELVHVGHECADKYQMLADRSDFMRALAAMKDQRASEIERAKRRIKREKYLSTREQLGVYLDAGCGKAEGEEEYLRPPRFAALLNQASTAKDRAERYSIDPAYVGRLALVERALTERARRAWKPPPHLRAKAKIAAARREVDEHLIVTVPAGELDPWRWDGSSAVADVRWIVLICPRRV